MPTPCPYSEMQWIEQGSAAFGCGPVLSMFGVGKFLACRCLATCVGGRGNGGEVRIPLQALDACCCRLIEDNLANSIIDNVKPWGSGVELQVPQMCHTCDTRSLHAFVIYIYIYVYVFVYRLHFTCLSHFVCRKQAPKQ